MIDFSAIKAISIPEGAVSQISSGGTIIWKVIEQETYKNWVRLSIDTDGSVFNGVGYQNSYRLSSSGAVKAQVNATVTGFIPVKGGDFIRIYGATWGNTSTSLNYFCGYDANFNFIGAVISSSQNFQYGTKIAIDNSWGLLEGTESDGFVELLNLDNIAYVRVSAYNAAGLDGTNIIVTVNEEIV